MKDTFPELFLNDRKRGKLHPLLSYWSIKQMLSCTVSVATWKTNQNLFYGSKFSEWSASRFHTGSNWPWNSTGVTTLCHMKFLDIQVKKEKLTPSSILHNSGLPWDLVIYKVIYWKNYSISRYNIHSFSGREKTDALMMLQQNRTVLTDRCCLSLWKYAVLVSNGFKLLTV